MAGTRVLPRRLSVRWSASLSSPAATRVRRFLRRYRILALRLLIIPAVVAPPIGLGWTALDWAVSVTAAAVWLCGRRWPLAVLLVQTALAAVMTALVAPQGLFHQGPGAVQIFVGLAAVEAIVRRSGAGLFTALAAAELVTSVNFVRHFGLPPAAVVPRLALSTGIVVLVGALIRSVRATVKEAEERAREVERRRQADTRAARAEERTAIARELHDLVAHHLSSIVLRTGVARHVGRDREGPGAVLGEVLDDVHRNASAGLADLRQLVGVLRDPERVDEGPGATVTDTDPRAALDAVVDRVSRAGLRVSAYIDPDLGRLDTMRRLAVLRLTQEALTNALRHATGATEAALSVERRGDTIRIEVNDDGSGLPVDDPYGSGGHGLAGMRERVDLVGGRFTAGATERGWRVVAELPVRERAATAR